jgi:uncharacterized RDD family membrane protein YckC
MSTEEGVYYRQEDYAGLFRRLVAETVDLLAAVALTLGVDWLVIRLSLDTIDPAMALALSAVIVGVVYLILVKRYLRTLGYVIAGTEIVNLQGNRPGIGALTLRLLFSFFGPLNPIVDILWIPGDAQRQTLRDKFAHTYVIKKGSSPQGKGPIRFRRYGAMGWNFLFQEVDRAPETRSAG